MPFPINKSPCEHKEEPKELSAVIKFYISCQPAAHTGKKWALRELLSSSSQLGQDQLFPPGAAL